MREWVRQTLRETAKNMGAAAEGDFVDSIADAVTMTSDAFHARDKLLVFGNGGSSADAQHFTAELVGRFLAERPVTGPCVDHKSGGAHDLEQ